MRADVEPLAAGAQFRNVADCCDLLDERAVLDLSFRARALLADALRDVVAYADRAAIRQRGNGHFRANHFALRVMHSERSEPFAMLFKCFSNLQLHRRPILGIRYLPP